MNECECCGNQTEVELTPCNRCGAMVCEGIRGFNLSVIALQPKTPEEWRKNLIEEFTITNVSCYEEEISRDRLPR